MKQRISNFSSYLVFLSTLSFVLISLFAIIFPGFFLSTYFPYDTDLEPFETSIWLIPVLSFSILFLILGFTYYKKKLPDKIYDCITFLLNFEISKRATLIIIITILVFYIGFSVNELSINEDGQWEDYQILKRALEIWPSTESDDIYIQEQNSRYVRMTLLVSSIEIFQNIKILPFVASVFLLVTTFLQLPQ